MIESNRLWISVVFVPLCIASQISFYVRYLDKKICDAIENPVLLGGKYLYRDLLDMAISLQRIEHAIKDENTEGDRQALDIIEEGGLNLPNIMQNDEKIMEAFNWTKKQAEELGTKTKDISSLWDKIVQGMNRKPLFPVDYDLESDKFIELNATSKL